MRTIKEGFLRKNLGLGKEALIKKWLDEHKITNYTINKDLTIDVDGSVDLSFYKEYLLPNFIQFGKVESMFNLSCSRLKSLRGCPHTVNGVFYCNKCNNLETLEYSPKFCGLGFNCSFCKNLKSLKGAPLTVYREFNCQDCISLKSLKYCTPIINGRIMCMGCGGKFTREDVKKNCKVTEFIYV